MSAAKLPPVSYMLTYRFGAFGTAAAPPATGSSRYAVYSLELREAAQILKLTFHKLLIISKLIVIKLSNTVVSAQPRVRDGKGCVGAALCGRP